MIETKTAPSTERVTPLRPSEAMRLGRLLYPKRCEVRLAKPQPDGWAVCALGSMAVGYGWEPSYDSNPGYDMVYDALGTRRTDCPLDDCRDATGLLVTTVHHLNDQHHWPTERIADWLSGLGL